MKIIADSGSTKTHWTILSGSELRQDLYTEGINPVFMDAGRLSYIVREAFRNFSFPEAGVEVYFYGAGVGLSQATDMMLKKLLSEIFHTEKIEAYSDLLAASRALFGHRPGITGILGTGSNSCLYDGGTILKNVKAGGFILGDEGSGAYLGKQLLGDYIKGFLPQELSEKFKVRYPEMDYAAIVEHVYKGEMPSRFLASFSWFLAENRECDYVQQIFRSSFDTFLNRNVMGYLEESRRFFPEPQRPQMGFVGSVAFYCQDMLREAADSKGLELVRILKEPMDGLIEYYR